MTDVTHLKARRPWKDAFRELVVSANLTSAVIADRANRRLWQLGSREEIKPSAVTHYRSRFPENPQPENTRVPQKQDVAWALLLALHDLGAVSEEQLLNPDDNLVKRLTVSLGFERPPRSLVLASERPAGRGEGHDYIRRMLALLSGEELRDYSQHPPRTVRRSEWDYVRVYVESDMGFLAGDDSQLAELVLQCVGGGTEVNYLIANAESRPDRWPAEAKELTSNFRYVAKRMQARDQLSGDPAGRLNWISRNRSTSEHAVADYVTRSVMVVYSSDDIVQTLAQLHIGVDMTIPPSTLNDVAWNPITMLQKLQSKIGPYLDELAEAERKDLLSDGQ